MCGISVHIAIESDDGRPVSLARIGDGEVIRSAARAAIKDATAGAEAAGRRDPLLGRLRAAEAASLESYFGLKIPGFAATRP